MSKVKTAGKTSAKRSKKVVSQEKVAPAAAKGRRKIEFAINAGPGHEAVYLAGSFNDWDPARKRLEDADNSGIYRGYVMLAPGEYEYKFVVDGEWRIDEDNPCLAPNDLGTLNSVLKVEAK